MSMRKTIFWLSAVLVLMIALVAGWSQFGRGHIPGGSMIDPPGPAPEITLTDTGGEEFRLSAHRGELVLLFFGYTYCPDVCPGTLKNMQVVFERLGGRAGEVRFVFITVDPARDDAARIRSYLDGFNPAFIGLTGSEDALERVYADYSVNVARGPAAGAAGYDVEHASRIFVVDREGRLIETFPYGLSRDAILADLQHLISLRDS